MDMCTQFFLNIVVIIFFTSFCNDKSFCNFVNIKENFHKETDRAIDLETKSADLCAAYSDWQFISNRTPFISKLELGYKPTENFITENRENWVLLNEK